MEVYFATKRLETDLATTDRRIKSSGATVARKLELRLSQLSAAPDLETMRSLPGRCHELHGDRADHLALDVTGNLRLVFRPTEQPPPAKDDGGLDWKAVAAITIVEVVDYHGR